MNSRISADAFLKMRFFVNFIGICLFLATSDIALSSRRVCWDERKFNDVEFNGNFKQIPEKKLDKCKAKCANTNGCYVVKLYKNPNRCFINDGRVTYRTTKETFEYSAYFMQSCKYYDEKRGITTTKPVNSKQTKLLESLDTGADLGYINKESCTEESEAIATVSTPSSIGSELGTGTILDVSLESDMKSAEESNPIVIDANSDNSIESNLKKTVLPSDLHSDQPSTKVSRKLLPSAKKRNPVVIDPNSKNSVDESKLWNQLSSSERRSDQKSKSVAKKRLPGTNTEKEIREIHSKNTKKSIQMN